MTQEDKQLLLVDLCARLPYGVKIHKEGSELDGTLIDTELRNDLMVITTATISVCTISIESCKPYLRPMSSMTEEERNELFELCEFAENEDWEGRKTEMYCITIAERFDPIHSYDTSFKFWGINMKAIDWLNSHHFDYRSFIERGLAIEAPEGMYNITK